MSVKQAKSGPSRVRAFRAAEAVDVAVCAAAVFAVLIALGGTMRTQGAARAAGVETGLVRGFVPLLPDASRAAEGPASGVREN